MERKEPGLWLQSQPGSAACCVTLGQAGNLVSLRCRSWEVGIIPSSQNHRWGSAGVRCPERCSWPSFGPPHSCLSFHLTTYVSALTFCDKLRKNILKCNICTAEYVHGTRPKCAAPRVSPLAGTRTHTNQHKM